MFARKLSTGMVAAAMTVSALALTAGPASAATAYADADDTSQSATPAFTATTLIGVGSDTSQHAVKVVGDGYNATSPAAPIFTYSATCSMAPTGTACGNISLPSGDIPRPNGSTSGKALLFGGTGNRGNTDIAFARSSSAESANEQSAGLQSFPYALDTLVTATSAQMPSNAPATLSIQDLVKIYTGAVTNWSQLGGSNAPIDPRLPQVGSGTRNFFLAQLTAANGNTPVTCDGVCGATVQEHDPAPIQNSPNVIAPFSQGRAGLANSSSQLIRVEGGFSANRAIYNVVRGSDVSLPAVQAAFGSNGYFCSAAAKAAIEASGFKQLLTPTKGGVCGATTQSATSNFTTAQAATSTSVAVSSATSSTATAAKIVATVTSSSAPSGTVSFYEGSTLIAANVPLVSGAATRTQPATVGAHTYRAVFTPAANTAFTGSEGTGTGTVSAVPATPPATPAPVKKAKAKLREAFKPKYVFGTTIVGKVTIGLGGTSEKSSGSVKVLLGKKVVGKGKLKSSKALVVLRHLKLGKNKLTLVWGGNKYGAAGKKSFIITIVKA